MSSDRRRSSRVACRIQAFIQRTEGSGISGRQVYCAEIEQMSDTGVRLRMPVMVPEGEHVVLYVGRLNYPVAYRRELEVVWAGKNDGPGSWMGGRMLGTGFRRHIGSIAELHVRN